MWFLKFKNMKSRAKLTSTLTAVMLLSGCVVTVKDAQTRVEQSAEQIKELKEQFATQNSLNASVTKVKGNFIVLRPIDLGYDNTLPAAFKDVTLRYPNATSLQQVAERITHATGIAVGINPDVFSPGANASKQAADSYQMDFRGNLGNFLDVISARGGFSWSYESGKIYFSRLITRAFEISASPGTSDYNSRVSKGSSASTGAAGGASAVATGSFTGSSDTSVKASNISSSDAMGKAISAMLTPEGKVVINEATGSIIVTDTQMVVDRVEKLIRQQNEIMTRQVSLQVELVTLDISEKTQFGIDANVIYKNLAQARNLSLTVSPAASLTTSSAGSVSYNVLPASNQTDGSSLLIQALNGIGNVTQKISIPLVATNRQPVPIANITTRGYLASTTPAAGGAIAGGTGVPGLTPGSVTTGLFLSVLPTVLDNNSVLLRMSIDQSNLVSIDTIGTGSGGSAQQIQIPNVTGFKSDHSVGLQNGDTLVLVGLMNDSINGQSQTGVLSLSQNNSKNKSMQIIFVTPRVMAGAGI